MTESCTRGKGDEHVSREQLADQILGMLPLIHRKLFEKIQIQ